MEKRRIALIFGGRGLERSVSVSGAEHLIKVIDRELFIPLLIFIDESGIWRLDKAKRDVSSFAAEAERLSETVFAYRDEGFSGLLTSQGEKIKIDCAIPLLHGDFGEDGTVQGTLETAGIPYVGCDTVSSAVCYDKIYTKALAESLKIPTAKWYAAINEEPNTARINVEMRLSYPMFIKPARLGSSFGASCVSSPDEFDAAYRTASDLGKKRVLIEERVDVERELECAFISIGDTDVFTPPGEISYTTPFYDYNTKYFSSFAAVKAESEYGKEYRDAVIEYSRRLRDLTGIKGISRFDFFLSTDKRLLFNEINTFPGFTEASLYPKMLEVAGIPLKDALSGLILAALDES